MDTLAGYLEKLFLIEKDLKTQRKKIELGLIELICGRSGEVFVAEVNGHTAGMGTGQLVVSTSTGGSSLLVEDVFVEEEYRGQGVGIMIMEALSSWGTLKGALRMQLVADKNNTAALKFYKKMGWKESNKTGMYHHLKR